MICSRCQLRQLEDLGNLGGKSVLLRADVNVPLADGEIADDFRIRASMETLVWLLEQGANVVLCGHLGRPNSKETASKNTASKNTALSMAPVEASVRELLASEMPDCPSSRLVVLENLRFNSGETANDPAFVAELIEGRDCYVNDAFGASHRAHASIVGPPQFLPSAAGRLLTKEVEVLLGLRNKPRRPFVALLGGAKVSDKLGVVSSLAESVDALLIGGAMAFTFLAAKGHNVGSSLFEPDFVDDCAKLLESDIRLLLPSDLVARDPQGQIKQTGVNLQEGWAGLDIGPGTAAEFADEISEAGCVFWNGPMGMFEDDRFAAGTKTVAEAVANTSAYTVIGGGDTAAAAATFGYTTTDLKATNSDFDHISTGGGASLELLQHGDLPGLAALRAK